MRNYLVFRYNNSYDAADPVILGSFSDESQAEAYAERYRLLMDSTLIGNIDNTIAVVPVEMDNVVADDLVSIVHCMVNNGSLDARSIMMQQIGTRDEILVRGHFGRGVQADHLYNATVAAAENVGAVFGVGYVINTRIDGVEEGNYLYSSSEQALLDAIQYPEMVTQIG